MRLRTHQFWVGVATLVVFAGIYYMYGIDPTIQLFAALIIGVFASYVASLIFAQRVERTIVDVIELEAQIVSLVKDMKTLQRLKQKLADFVFELPEGQQLRGRDLLRRLEDGLTDIKESIDRIDQSVKVFSRIEGRK